MARRARHCYRIVREKSSGRTILRKYPTQFLLLSQGYLYWWWHLGEFRMGSVIMMTGEEGFDFGDSCYVDNHFCYLLGYGGPEGWALRKGAHGAG